MADEHSPEGAAANVPREIEIKLRVPDLDTIRKLLPARGAVLIERVLETNQFFDRPDGALRQAGSGLRLRLTEKVTSTFFEHTDTRQGEDSSAPTALLTWKGPPSQSVMHNRPSLDLTAAPAELAGAFLKALGFVPTVAFEKRRESWSLQERAEAAPGSPANRTCRVELDALPQLGCFVEIEGPDEAAVLNVRRQLALDSVANEPATYLAMVSRYLQAHPSSDNKLRFPADHAHPHHSNLRAATGRFGRRNK